MVKLPKDKDFAILRGLDQGLSDRAVARLVGVSHDSVRSRRLEHRPSLQITKAGRPFRLSPSARKYVILSS